MIAQALQTAAAAETARVLLVTHDGNSTTPVDELFGVEPTRLQQLLQNVLEDERKLAKAEAAARSYSQKQEKKRDRERSFWKKGKGKGRKIRHY